MTEWLDVSDETPRVAYTATNGQTVFDVDFVFFSEDDLKVYQNDVLLTLSTHYVTSGAEDEDGGAVTLVTGATAGDSIVITREIEISLTTHIPPSGPLDIPAVNLQFSRFVAMLQQVADERARSVRQPDEDADQMDDLPNATDRASKYLFFDADGNPTAVAAVTGTAAVDAFWVTVLQTASAAAARSALGITDQTSYAGQFNFRTFR